ncbi:MAG: hypothetical protein IKO03_09580 [Lachnospiraceae bacterium]|nr:hypothetical protein [Lachnospiraceae bacterium]
MAKITNFNEEREKRRSDARERQDQAEQKIARHKLFRLIRILVIITILVGTGIFMYVRYRGKIYVGYDVINSVERTKVDGAKDVKLGNSVLTYSRDGAHSVDVKGVMTWNQSFEIQDIQLAICRNVCAICGYNGHEIFVQSSENQLGQIQTNLPIKNLTVAATGRVTAVLEDTNVMWLNTYEPSGQNIYEGQFHMSQSGYPCAISLSPNGDLLAVSFIFVEEGSYVTNIAFYNYGPVGDNQSDQLVSTFTYRDMIVPEIHFMTNGAAFAVADNRLMFYSGEQVPTTKKEHILDREIKAVYYNQNYVGLIFASDRADAKYVLRIYDTAGENVAERYFDMDYLGVFFEQGTYALYNSTDCMIYTMAGGCKYEGKFDKPISLMLPTETPYRYRVVTDTSIDTIQLK